MRATDPDFDGDFDDLIIVLSEEPLVGVYGAKSDKFGGDRHENRREGTPAAVSEHIDPPEMSLHSGWDPASWMTPSIAELWT
jgi:hypothetical protein